MLRVMFDRVRKFYFGNELTPGIFLARGFLTGAAAAVIIGSILLVLGIH